MNSNVALVGEGVGSSLAVGYLLGKIHGSRRYADDYIQRPGREFKKDRRLEYISRIRRQIFIAGASCSHGAERGR